MSKITQLALTAAVCLIASTAPALAQQGFYLGFETALGFGGEFSTSSSDNDLPSVCDQYLHDRTTGTTPDNNLCDGSQGDAWSSNFDSSNSFLSGLSGGYHFNNSLRAEAEYLFSHNSYDQNANVIQNSAQVGDKLNGELTDAYERIGSLRAHSLLLNGYYDLNTQALANWTPYAGAGIGIAWMNANYNAIFTRSLDVDNITSADNAGLPPDELDAFKQAAAGTTTVGHSVLRDVVLVWQIILGLDYRINDQIALGGKARFVRFGAVEDGAPWNQLRSHASNNDENKPEDSRVRYNVDTGAIDLWGIGFSLRYSF